MERHSKIIDSWNKCRLYLRGVVCVCVCVFVRMYFMVCVCMGSEVMTVVFTPTYTPTHSPTNTQGYLLCLWLTVSDG